MLAHLTIATREVQRTADLLSRVMGWKQLSMPDNIDVDACWLEIGNNQQIHVLQVDDFSASAFENEYGRHVAFFHPGDDWDALQLRLKSEGIEIIPALRPTPFPRFFFRDFNGYLWEVIDQDQFVSESNS